MGLFSGKVCVRCGNKAGLLSREKLADGEYICSDCRDLCSPELTSDDFHNMTLDDVEANIKECEENAERYKNEFVASTTIRSKMALSSKDVLYADDARGWWVNATVESPDIFTFDQVGGCRLELQTSSKDDDDKNPSLIDMFGGPEALSRQYPGLPSCPPGEQIDGMTFCIRIVKHPPFTEVRIPVMDAFIPTESDIRGGYDAAWQLMTFFKEKQAGRNAQIQSANMAAAVAQATAAALSAAQSAQAQPAQAAGGDVTDQILKLKQLLDAGILTQDEFDAKKKQLLGL